MMKIDMNLILSLFMLMVLIHHPTVSTIILADFQQQALLQHNYLRQLHCTGAMVLNSTLNAIAQNYSEYLAANNLFQHSGAAGLGENLYSMSSSNIITFVNGSTPTTSWYNEISLYNYNSPGFSSATGHFTQVIWVGSTQMGIGIGYSSDNKTVTVTANYYPAGNVIGSFPANVLPLCSSSTSASASSLPSSSTSNNSAMIGVQSNTCLSGMIIVASALLNIFSQN